MRIFRRVAQMFDFQNDVAEGEFLTKQGGLLVGSAGGGGGLTFAQLAAIGVTIDETTGEVNIAPVALDSGLALNLVAAQDGSNQVVGFQVQFMGGTKTPFSVAYPGGPGAPSVSIDSGDAATLALGVYGKSNQTENLAEFYRGGTVVVTVDENGRLGIGGYSNGELLGVWTSLTDKAWTIKAAGHESLWALAAAADGDVATAERVQWYDDTVGATKLRFKQRDSAGTLVTGASASEAYADAGVAAHVGDATDAHAGTALTNTPAGNVAATTVQAAINELDSEKAAAVHVHSGADITSGTVVDARIDAAIARDSEVTAAVAAEATARDTAIGVETSARTAADALLVPKSLYDANTILTATTDDTPAALTVAASTILGRKASGNIAAMTATEAKAVLAIAESDVTNLTTDLAAKVPNSLFDANTVLAANADDTPAALTMGASTILARLAAGNIKAATPAELKTLLAIAADDLSDVVIASAAAGQQVRHDGSTFVNVPPLLKYLSPTGAFAETYPRAYGGAISQQAALSTQRVTLVAIHLDKGQVVTSVAFCSGGTALNTGVHQYFGLYDSALGRLAVTADDTSTAWGTNAIKKLNLSPGTFTCTYSGLHYLAVLVDATTVPTLMGGGSISSAASNSTYGIISGTSSTGQTSLPVTAGALTALGFMVWGFVS